MELQLTSDKNNIYKIIIKQISQMILFKVESKELPKKLIQKGFSYEQMKNNFNFFNKVEFKNIELIYKQLKLLIESYKNKLNELKCELKEDDEKIEFIIKTKDFNDELIEIIDILFPQKIDVDITLYKLTTLYKKLKQEKDDEINNLNELQNEIKDSKEEHKKELNKLKNEINDLKGTHNNEMIFSNEEYNKVLNELKNEINELK